MILSRRCPPLTSSMMTYMCLFDSNVSRNSMQFGCWTFLMISISRTANLTSSLPSASILGMILTATVSPVFLWMAVLTTPYLPLPSSSLWISYSFLIPLCVSDMTNDTAALNAPILPPPSEVAGRWAGAEALWVGELGVRWAVAGDLWAGRVRDAGLSLGLSCFRHGEGRWRGEGLQIGEGLWCGECAASPDRENSSLAKGGEEGQLLVLKKAYCISCPIS
mmetsp:Transcript_496/g.1166  ORF Transcript_496/g.1166 Transcript_496/m.1166 type:complete len:221 (+) Transcript_496:1206-1868(+)